MKIQTKSIDKNVLRHLIFDICYQHIMVRDRICCEIVSVPCSSFQSVADSYELEYRFIKFIGSDRFILNILFDASYDDSFFEIFCCSLNIRMASLQYESLYASSVLFSF